MIQQLINKGFSLIPLNENKSPNIKSWTEYQKTKITDVSFFKDNNVGLICGEVSGNILAIDVDCKYDLTGTLFLDLVELIKNSKDGLFEKMQINATKNNGFHLIFATQNKPIGNKKLASRPATQEEVLKGEKVKVLIETRGEGGYICYPPTDGYKILKDGFETLNDEEVDVVLSCCRSFNKIEIKETVFKNKIDESNFITSPFDDYNQRGDCLQELYSNGWTFVYQKGANTHLKRPGGTDSVTSANYSSKHNKFYVFSTSTIFTESVAYSPVGVYCKLYHNDKWIDCAKDLISKGYGKKRQIIDKKYSTIIRKLKKEGTSEEDIIFELRKIDGKSLNDLKEIISNYDSNIGQKISTFWKVDIKQNGDSKITISYYDFCRFLNQQLNVFRFKLDKESEGFRYVKLNNSIITAVTMADIKDMVKDYLESLENYFDGIYKDQLLEVLYRSSNSIFSDNMLEFLEYTDVEILRCTKNEVYFPFLNGIVKVSTFNKIQIINYDEVNGLHIWDNQIIKHNIDLDFDYNEFSFNRFLMKINSDDENRYLFCAQCIGYALSQFRDPLNPITLVFGEETSDTNLGGGSGKGILVNAISKLTPTVIIDGKSFNPDSEFAFQRVNVNSKAVVLQDTKPNFKFETLYSKTTDGFTVRKLFTPEFFIPYENSPIFIITTNYTIDNESSAADRRLKLLEFSSFFNSKNKPIDYLGEVLFNSWDSKKWNKFYTLIFDCVLLYLEQGFTEVKETQTSKIKRICTKYEENFYDWFTFYKVDDFIDFQKLYADFLASGGYDSKGYSQKRFSSALKYACETLNCNRETITDPVTKLLKVKWTNNNPEAIIKNNNNILDF